MLENTVTAYLRYFPRTFIFCYHRVIPQAIAIEQLVHSALYVTPETFESQIKWMMRHGRIITSDELYQPTTHTRFMVTFDDGWRDNFTYAVPILRKYKIASTFFVTTKNIDDREHFWTDNIGLLVADALKLHSQEHIIKIMRNIILNIVSEYKVQGTCNLNEKTRDIYHILHVFIECLKQLPVKDRQLACLSLCKELKIDYHNSGDNHLLTWSEIQSMAEEHHKFGSHTHTHSLLDQVENASIDYEISQSKRILEKRLAQDINAFSYPNGNYANPYIQGSLRRHGFKYAFILRARAFHYDERYLIPRCILFEKNAASLDRYFLRYLSVWKIRSLLKKMARNKCI